MTFSSSAWVKNSRGIIGVEHEKIQDELDSGRQSKEDQLVARENHTKKDEKGVACQ